MQGIVRIVSNEAEAVKEIKAITYVESFDEAYFIRNREVGIWTLEGNYLRAELLTPAEYHSAIREEYQAQARKVLGLLNAHKER